jgi:versiconal hemiacetal acetate esterase
VESLREQFAALGGVIASMYPPPDPTISVQTVQINSNVGVRIYTPKEAKDGPLATGVYFHGGGWSLGDLDSEDAWCRSIALNTPCIIVSVEYRLTPEHKFPTPLDDSIDAFDWVCSKPQAIEKLRGSSDG